MGTDKYRIEWLKNEVSDADISNCKYVLRCVPRGSITSRFAIYINNFELWVKANCLNMCMTKYCLKEKYR